MIRDIPLIVDSPGSESGATHPPPATGNQYHLNVGYWSLLLHVALDQRDAPMFLNVLGNEFLAHSIVPHVPRVNIGQILSALTQVLGLLRPRQVEVKSKEAAIRQILGYLFQYGLHLLLLVLCHIPVEDNKFDLL